MKRNKNDKLEQLLARARKEERKKMGDEDQPEYYRPSLHYHQEPGWDLGDYIFFWLANFLLVLTLLYLVTGDGLSFLSRLFL